MGHDAAAYAVGGDERRRHRAAERQRGIAAVGEAALLPDHRLPQLRDACRIGRLVAGEPYRIVAVGLGPQRAGEHRVARHGVDAQFGFECEKLVLGVGEADFPVVGNSPGGVHFDILADVEEREGAGFDGSFEDTRVESVADLVVGALDSPGVAALRTPCCGIVQHVLDPCRTHFQLRVAGRADDCENRDIAALRAVRPEGDRAVSCDADIAVRRREVHRRAAACQP